MRANFSALPFFDWPRDVIGPYALGPQRADGGIADGVTRNRRDEMTVETEMRETHCDVCFAAAEGRRQ